MISLPTTPLSRPPTPSRSSSPPHSFSSTPLSLSLSGKQTDRQTIAERTQETPIEEPCIQNVGEKTGHIAAY